MNVTEARAVLKNSKASNNKKQAAKKVVKVADLRNLLARNSASKKQLAVETKRVKEFKFWTKSESNCPFAKGTIPIEAETAPGLSTMHDEMRSRYGERGRGMFYAQLRKISPSSKLMRHVFSVLKQIVTAKQKNRTSVVKGLRTHLNQLKRLVTRFENYRKDKQYAQAAMILSKIDLLL